MLLRMSLATGKLQIPFSFRFIVLPFRVDFQVDLLLVREFRIAICCFGGQLSRRFVIPRSFFKVIDEATVMLARREFYRMAIISVFT